MLVFVVEAAVKIVALGCVMHEGAYLREPANVLDAIVVVIHACICMLIWML